MRKQPSHNKLGRDCLGKHSVSVLRDATISCLRLRMVRTLPTVLVISASLAAGLVLTACGGSSSPASTAVATVAGGSAIGTTSATGTSAATGAPVANGLVDCSIKGSPRFLSLVTGLQVIAQMNNQSMVDTLKATKVGGYDPQEVSKVLEALKPLGGRDYPPFGDPGPTIDLYLRSNEKAAELWAIKGAIPQEKFDELSRIVGDQVQFFSKQASIGQALETACSSKG
jgi:hypothetical protein